MPTFGGLAVMLAQSATMALGCEMPKRSVEAAWNLLVDEYLPFVRETLGIPGIAIAVVSLEAEFERTAALGVRSLAASDGVDQHTAFPLASLSKPIGSTILALLMAERQRLSSKTLAWTDEVEGFSIARPSTYASLFSHRSGLPDHAGDLLEDLGFDRAAILDRLGKLALNSIDSYAYTNFGLTAAAVRAAESVGEVWEDLADRLLYRKLGMDSTSSRFEIFCGRENRTWGHRPGDDGRWVVGRPQRNPDAQTPAGGVTSTAHDLIAWMKLHLGDLETLKKVDLADSEWITQTHRHYLGNEGYGYGWNVTSDAAGQVVTLSHSGAFDMGAGTSVFLWPREKLGIVALTNAAPTGAPEALCLAFKRLLDDDQLTVEQLRTVEGPSRERPDRPLTFLANFVDSMHAQLQPPRRDAGQPTPGETFAFDGTYGSEFYGDARFELEGGELIMYLGNKTADFDNRHTLRRTSAPNVFVYDSNGEFGRPNNRVEFLRGDGSEPDRVRLWNLFVAYPQSLDETSDGICPLEGVLRAWSVVSNAPGKIALTVIRKGDPKIHVQPTVEVFRGTNRFADANIEVRAGDKIGFWSDAEPKTYWQQPGANIETLEFEIDREGTFVRNAGS
jgi:CubicO group peptidase (beta-lactamase class C family)